jgi:hypothetical protein
MPASSNDVLAVARRCSRVLHVARAHAPSAQLLKANSSILNSLLTILNERTFDNGAARVHVPLLCLVGASNELPESDELDALFDRFLLRHAVSQARLAGRIRECAKP